MNKKDVKLFYEDLENSIIQLYHVDKTVACDAIKISDMDKIIDKIGNFVFHDVVEYWAASVWACYKRKKI